MAWGRLEKQHRDKEAGNIYMKDEALKIVERTMEEYWQPEPELDIELSSADETTAKLKHKCNNTLRPKFDCHQQKLSEQSQKHDSSGWAAELHCYLSDLPPNVMRKMDVVTWWVVCLAQLLG